MSRPAKYDRETMLDQALALVGEGGPQALTMTALGEAVGAPSGSVYHRFSGRDVLLAEVWLRTVERFQSEFLGRLERGDVKEAARAAAGVVLDWVAANPDAARLLLVYRREDLLADDWPPAHRRRARRLAAEFAAAADSFAARLGGRDAHLRAWFVLVDLPAAAVRRHIANRQPVPTAARRLLFRAIDAFLTPG